MISKATTPIAYNIVFLFVFSIAFTSLFLKKCTAFPRKFCAGAKIHYVLYHIFRQISICPVKYVSKMPPTKGGIFFSIAERHSRVSRSIRPGIVLPCNYHRSCPQRYIRFRFQLFARYLHGRRVRPADLTNHQGNPSQRR